MTEAIRTLIDALAEIFDKEGRPGGDEAAAALRRHRDDPLHEVGATTDLCAQLRLLCDTPDALPAARLVGAVWEHLPWHHSGTRDGRIPWSVAQGMLTAEILGESGPIKCDTCRVGLFAQTAGVEYLTRRHAAEETFITLAGEGEWRLPPEDWYTLGPGGIAHHPSMAEHQSRTGPNANLMLWRWTGDIGWGSYTFDR